eukprot:gene20690-22838_t
MVAADGRLLMLIGMGKTKLLENKNLQDPSHPEDWVAAGGNGYPCKGKLMKNWLFVIPDGVGDADSDASAGTSAGDGRGAPSGVGVGVGVGVGAAAAATGGLRESVMNNTNLRGGNLHDPAGVPTSSLTACAELCDSNDSCYAWVYQSSSHLCFPKTEKFCINPSSNPCGGAKRTQCSNPPPPPPSPPGPTPPAPPKVGRACGRMGFASDDIMGPYEYCQFVEQPDPQGLDDPGGPASNCDSWPGDLIQAKDGWGNIYKAENGTLDFKRLPGEATIARPTPH